MSVLVGVVKLSVSGEAIQRSMPILWGEIVPYEAKIGVNQDWTYRSKGFGLIEYFLIKIWWLVLIFFIGRMAIRLLSKADCVGMRDEAETHIEIGTRVAIIGKLFFESWAWIDLDKAVFKKITWKFTIVFFIQTIWIKIQ